MAKNPRVEQAMQAAAKLAIDPNAPQMTIDPPPVTPVVVVPQVPPVATPVVTPVVPVVESVVTVVPVVPPVIPDDVPDFLRPQPVVAPVVPVTPKTDDKDINFANLRKAKEQIEAERDALKQKVSSIFDDTGKIKEDFVKGLKIESPDVAKIQQERDEALDRLAKVDLQSDPRWQAKYHQAETMARQSILSVAKEYGVESKDVQNALLMPIKERIKFFNENLPDALPLLAPHIARLDEIRLSKETDISNASALRKQMDDQNAGVKERAITEARQTIHLQSFRKLEEQGYLPFRYIPGNDAWNKGVDGLKKFTGEALASTDVNLTGELIVAGASVPVWKVLTDSLVAENRELRKQLTLHAGAGATITPVNGTPVAPVEDLSNATPQDLAKAAIRSSQARRGGIR